MPRIRKLQHGGASRKLGECFKLLLSGASGECLAGELGCCSDSCCSSALISRALAEYCQHSDAAREAFVAAKGIDALQTALLRGSPSAAVGAARVLGALCAGPHGLRCVLRWQSASGGDLLSRLALVAGAGGGGSGGGGGGVAGEGAGAGLPPELRTECVDALRAALGALHGPAAGGGLELAGALQVNASNPLGAFPGDFLTRVALPPLLSSNAHLRAAAARLIVAAAEEGLLPSGGGAAAAAAATLSAALGLAGLVSGNRADGALGVSGARASGDRPQRPCTLPRGGGLHVLALCELVASLLDSPSGAELLEAMRGPSLVLALALGREASAADGGGGVSGGGGGGEWPDSGSGDDSTEREALLDAVLLCVRHGYDRLWAAPDEEKQRERRAFALGAARLATLLTTTRTTAAAAASDAAAGAAAATAGDCGRGASVFPVGVLVGRGGAVAPSRSISTAAALASALSYWPQSVLSHADLREALADLRCALSDAVASALRRGSLGGGGGGAAEELADGVQQPATAQPAAATGDPGVWGSGWREAAPRAARFGGSKIGGISGSAGCSTMYEAAALHAVASAAAAAIRLYGAAGGRRAPSASGAATTAAAADSPSLRGVSDGIRCCEATAVAQCLGHLLEAARDCRTATALLTAPLEALLELPDEPPDLLLTASSAMPSCGSSTDAGGLPLLPVLALAAAGLVERLLQLPTGDTATPLSAASPGGTSSWVWHHAAGGGSSGVGTRRDITGRWGGASAPAQSGHGGGGLQHSAEQHAALLAALRVWSRLMGLRRSCTCGETRLHVGEQPTCPDDSGIVAPVACQACSIRPLGPLVAVAEAAEGLLPQPTQSGGRDAELGGGGESPQYTSATPGGIVEPASGTAKPGYGVLGADEEPSCSAEWHPEGPASEHSASGAASSCGGSQDRVTQLQQVLARTLSAALRGYAPGSSAANPSCAPGSWNRIRTCTSRVLGIALDPRNPRSVGAAVSVSATGDTQDITPLDSRDADLADADTILDECLACIAAASWA
ncbi:hypothetical protein PLESTB_000382000 [Pleodorina starrii]|uniref:Uncharacterized protein n=1 Tax=Pleodorina starrii TaxID=330485 RepID=A0A9W6BEA8_9CHLO|nr:hypothetical protein PLESTM_000013100 [Pleodorina starrii]GLC50463.1 hypothetical protein PLESTB_000382000 [Pleodorina starrii]GLC73300.1 hypothetical protein PLESTF_001358000 [Pleodorina starrii]